MNQVGELIRETIEAMETGGSDMAFASACAALKITLQKALEKDDLASGDYHHFVKQNWRLISFMGLPRALPMPPDVDAQLKLIVHGFNINGAEELILHLVRQTAQTGRTPAQFKFYSGATFEIRASQVFIPSSVIGAIIGIVIFQAVNKNETVPDRYWINISDFKMFISEFWGRLDLAERIMNFYLN